MVEMKEADTQDKDMRKVFVSYNDQRVTSEDLKMFFSQFGDITDVKVSCPWKNYAFVTFADYNVTQSMYGRQFTIKDIPVLVRVPKDQGGAGGNSGGYGNMGDGWGNMGGYGGMNSGGYMAGSGGFGGNFARNTGFGWEDRTNNGNGGFRK